VTRREWLALGALTLSTACGPRKGTGFAGYALVATSGEDALAVVDLTAFELQDPIQLGAQPTAIVPGPASHSYALTPSTGSIHTIDESLKVVSSRKLADELSAIRVTPDRKRIVAIATKTREYIEADSISLRVIRRQKLDAAPVALDVSPVPEAAFAAVSTGNHGTVDIFNYETGGRWRTQIAGQIGSVRFRGDGQRLLAANLRDRTLIALTVPGLEMVAELPLAMQPQNLCFKIDHGQLFVSGEGIDGVAIVFPYTPFEVDQTVLAGRDPGVMACSGPNPDYLFVGSHSGSDVCVLNIDTRKVIGIVDVAQRPTYITTTPDNQYALVLKESGGDMAVIHISTIQANVGIASKFRNKSTASLFTMLPVGARPVHAAVVPRKA
jgi:DNA-binding beta-propeller fold protein YncE